MWVRGEEEEVKDRSKLNAFNVTSTTSNGANTVIWYCPTNQTCGFTTKVQKLLTSRKNFQFQVGGTCMVCMKYWRKCGWKGTCHNNKITLE